ncbi:hypothetical protein BGZ46_005631 [Entomortierella lignicola]|nr:hypothetical protein BGZ46_005631 [Entomortierella lignicola]
MQRVSDTNGSFSGVLATTISTKTTVQHRSTAATVDVADSETILNSESKGAIVNAKSTSKFNNTSLFDDKANKDARLSQQTLKALTTLSERTNTTGAPSRPISKSEITQNRGTRGGNLVVNKPLDNPFLDRPPTKLFKTSHFNTFSAFNGQPRDKSAGNSKQNGPESIRTVPAKKQQPSLVLKRVLAINSPNKNMNRDNKPSLPTVKSTTIPSTADNPVLGMPTEEGSKYYARPISQPTITNQHDSTSDDHQYITSDDSSSVDKEHGGNKEHGRNDDHQLHRRSVSSSMLEFARRSIMQHASASPKTAVRNINRVTADSNGKPSIVDLLRASEPHSSEELLQESFAKPDTPFTFESTPLPPLNVNASRLSSVLLETNLLDSVRETGNQRTGAKSSNSVEPVESRVGSEAQERHEILDLQESNEPGPSTYDSKSTLRENLARSQLNNAFLPRASIAHRAVPYKPPTVNEREALRTSRTQGYRARPFNPKVFTSAGDLGVPRIKKLPLTIPVSPVFSKPRVKTSVSSESNPTKTAASVRLANLIKSRPDRRPANNLQATKAGNTSSGEINAGSNTVLENTSQSARSTLLSVPNVDQVRSIPNSSESTVQRPTNVSNSARGVLGRLSSGLGTRMTIQGPPMREVGTTSSSTLAPTPNDHTGDTTDLNRSQGISLVRRPLTKPIPFKFATDDLLRKRHVMFKSKKAPETTSTTTVSKDTSIDHSSQNGNSRLVRHPQPPRKTLTVPVPFQLATQRRAEIYSHIHNHPEAQQPSSSVLARRPSRLAGLLPIRSLVHHQEASTAGKTSHFTPTIPISPKFGQRTQVPSLQPTRFLLKKSTKELTQPQEFHFHSETRAKERELFEGSVKKRERELAELKERTARMSREREQRMKLRENLEKTYRARPIKHYQPITIHKATRPLTKPVSPMIGEKRKRHEMELQFLQQDQEREQLGHSLQSNNNNRLSFSQNTRPNSVNPEPTVDREIYQQYEKGKILQEEHQALQKQLTRQEQMQLELANSGRATIFQPPIRLSFPLDPELQGLQDNGAEADKSKVGDDGNQQMNVIPPLPPVRDSFGGSNSHHLSRELRRISLEASRGSGGVYRKRLSDIGSRVSSGSGGSNRGSLNGRTSLEGDSGTAGYYPFTRSQAPTNSTTNEIPSTSRPRTAEQESEDRRRSGSFIPIDVHETSKIISPSRTSRLSSGLFGSINNSSGTQLSNTGSGSRSDSQSRPIRPVVIEHTLSLDDL